MSMMELKGFSKLQGLDTLLAESNSKSLSVKESIQEIPVGLLQSGKYQPRLDMDADSLNDLAASIQSQGIILPLIVRSVDTDRYEIIAGERRWRAAQIAGLEVVPAIVRNVPDETALAFALIENIQRESLNPIDEALAFARLKDDFAMTHEEISERVGRSRSSVTNLMRLLGLCNKVKDLLRLRKLEMGHARALLMLDAEQQVKIARKVVEKGLSVRETEKLVQQGKQPASKSASENHYGVKAKGWEGTLSQLVSSKTKVTLNKNGDGKIVIYVNAPEEVEWLIDTIRCGQK